ncbi:multidrug effflux MFS transporter [Falsirhodobacter deserti]|uniref:multidrug effflux MFS transporter n=1 Tax=Falsirhodobacter deserti TaxID=1365611 RepID=UPI000FE2B8BE|nr:multidrug effflux MFS transporter [Falsirhodobacter deserti]
MIAKRAPGQVEFIALIAAMMATVAFSIDSMLPALPDITAELTPDAPNHVQLIVTLFMLGMGVGTLIMGPVSDAIGRKATMIGCSVIYCLGALIAWISGDLEWMLVGRVVQGIGAAGPRVVAIAMVRDLYVGRDMARVVSFIMMVFTLVPAVAPMIGSIIISASDWRSLFFAFVLFSVLSTTWLWIRQPETLKVENRRALQVSMLRLGLVEVLRNRIVIISMIVQGLIMSCMFATISSIQQIFEVRFDRAETFPYWFALIALVAGVSSFVNARLVMTIGMRTLITSVIGVQVVVSTLMAVTNGFGIMPEGFAFAAQVLWTMTMFGMLGLSMGNLNALALEPLGHLAGLGASIIGCFSTIMGVVLATPVGQAFDGTNVPLATGIAIYTGTALVLMRLIPKRH